MSGRGGGGRCCRRGGGWRGSRGVGGRFGVRDVDPVDRRIGVVGWVPVCECCGRTDRDCCYHVLFLSVRMVVEIPSHVAREGPSGSNDAGGEAGHVVRFVAVVNHRVGDRTSQFHRERQIVATAVHHVIIDPDHVSRFIIRRIVQDIVGIKNAQQGNADIIGTRLLRNANLRGGERRLLAAVRDSWSAQ